MNVSSKLNRQLDFLRLGLWTLMLMLLIASMSHVAWLFSTIESLNLANGWIAAVGFDFGIFLLTMLANRQRTSVTQRRFIRIGIYVNAALSAIANVMYGVEHQVELERVHGFLWVMIPYIFALALPVMVVFFAEVLSSQEQALEKELEAAMRKEQKKQARLTAGQNRGQNRGQEAGQETGQETGQGAGHDLVKKGQIKRTERLDLVVEAVVKGRRSRAEIVEYTGIPKGSVSNLLNELYSHNRLKKNEFDQPEPLITNSNLTIINQ